MYKRVLVPLDGSLPAATALSVGEQLAERLDAELHVLALVKHDQTESSVRYSIKKQVARIDRELRLDIRLLSYSIPEDIAAESDAVDQTLVVMQTWARGRSAGLLHNVSEDVLRMVREPMVVLGPDPHLAEDWLEGPMCITTDGSHFGDSVAEPAAQLAQDLGIGVELITVVDQSSVPANVSVASEANSVIGISKAIGEMVDSTVNYDVLHGSDPARAIVDHADNVNASFVAMSTHGRSGIARLASDSVAMNVVRHTSCPVLLHRPPKT